MTNKSQHTTTCGETVLAFLISLLLILPIAFWFGFVGHALWGWFIVPIGVSQIGIWQAAGIGLLATLFTLKSSTTITEEYKNARALRAQSRLRRSQGKRFAMPPR